MTSIARYTALLLLSTLLTGTLAACSGPNPKDKAAARNQLKTRMQPSVDTQKVLADLAGPNIQSLDEAVEQNAQQAMERGQYKNAAQLYIQLAEKKPDNKSYILKSAEAMRMGGFYENALSQYRKIENDEKLGLDAKEGIGLSYLADGEFDKAGDELAQVMEKDPKRWRTVNAIGILFTTKQMYPEARQYFQEAAAIASNNVSVKNNLALLEALDRQYDESIRIFTEAARDAGKRSEQRKLLDMNMALVYAIKGDLDMAGQAVTPHLTEAQKLNNMAFYAELQGDDKLAKSYLNMALTKSEKYYDKAWKNLQTLNKLKERAPAGKKR